MFAALRPVAAMALLTLAPVFAPAPALAETAQFSLKLAGITAGSLSFDGSAGGKSYQVSGRLKTSGLAAMLKKVSYVASASGAVAGGRLIATRYDERADTGKRKSQVEMIWKSGVPQVLTYAPERAPRDWDIEASKQKGTVDPLSGMFAVLRAVPAGQECGASVKMFDGRRATQVTTGSPKKDGDRVSCNGEYRRLAGFSPEDMAEKTRFPFTLTYGPAGDGMMRVEEVAMDTVFGKGRLVRQ